MRVGVGVGVGVRVRVGVGVRVRSPPLVGVVESLELLVDRYLGIRLLLLVGQGLPVIDPALSGHLPGSNPAGWACGSAQLVPLPRVLVTIGTYGSVAEAAQREQSRQGKPR